MTDTDLEHSMIWESFTGFLTLEQMGKVKLMNRVDTKFVMPSPRVAELLELAAPGYYVQITDSLKIAGYDTVYFDTDRSDYYIMHHNRRLARQKIRSRIYLNSGITFLEIKNKSNRGRTKKKRILVEGGHPESLTEDYAIKEFLEGRLDFPAHSLSPHLRTRFDRITLVSKAMTERVTIDINLSFENLKNGNVYAMPWISIIEIKQDGTCHSDMKDILRCMHIHRMGFSKYCIGTATTDPKIKKNNFKEKLTIVKHIEKNAQNTSVSTGI